MKSIVLGFCRIFKCHYDSVKNTQKQRFYFKNNVFVAIDAAKFVHTDVKHVQNDAKVPPKDAKRVHHDAKVRRFATSLKHEIPNPKSETNLSKIQNFKTSLSEKLGSFGFVFCGIRPWETGRSLFE